MNLKTAFKKARLGLLLSTGLLTGTVAQSQTTDTTKTRTTTIPVMIPHRHFQTETPKPLTPNERLIKQARDNYDSLIMKNKNVWSKHLDKMEENINNHIQTLDTTRFSRFDRVHVIDQHMIDVAEALGIPYGGAVAKVLFLEKDFRKGVPPLNSLLSSLYNFQRSINKHNGRATYPVVTSSDPQLLDDHKEHHGYLIPVMPYGRSEFIDEIEGFTQKQKVNYVNKHETAHAIDNHFMHNLPRPITKQDSTDFDNINFYDHFSFFKTDMGKRLFSALYTRECYADVYAIGEMIREGEDISIIDIVRNTRQDNPKDLTHMSIPFLNTLKNRIQTMGIERFRNLSDEKALALYVKVTNKNKPSVKSIEKALDFYQNPYHTTRWIGSLFNRETRKGWKIYRSMRQTLPSKDSLGNYTLEMAKERIEKIEKRQKEFKLNLIDTVRAKADTTAVLKAVKDYTPLDDIYNTAFKNSGKIIPETYIQAYVTLQNDLITQWMDKNISKRDEMILEEKMAMLRNKFVVNLTATDYIAINKERGVDISNIIPPHEKPETDIFFWQQSQPMLKKR